MGSAAKATLGPSPASPPASPNRRANHIAGVFAATSVRAPCPNNRRAKNPSPTTTSPGAAAIRKHPPVSPTTIPTPTARSPNRSVSRPTSESGSAAKKLA